MPGEPKRVTAVREEGAEALPQVDVVYVAMYVSQGLLPTAGLYAGFLVAAVFGYREWRASARAAA